MVTWNLRIDRWEVYVIVSNLHMFGDVLSDPFRGFKWTNHVML